MGGIDDEVPMALPGRKERLEMELGYQIGQRLAVGS